MASVVIRKCAKCGIDVEVDKKMADIIDAVISAPLLCMDCAKKVPNG